MKFIYTLALIAVTTFGFAQKTVTVPTIAFKVPLGETVQLDAVSFSLTEIIEDSRCPSDVTCVWAGSAKVAVLISEKGKDAVTEVVLFKNGKQSLLFETKTSAFYAVRLSPYPTSSTKNTMKYELLISAREK